MGKRGRDSHKPKADVKKSPRSSSPQSTSHNGNPPSKKQKMNGDHHSDVEIVCAAYEYLKQNGNYYRRRRWHGFVSKYLDHKDPMVKWFCCQCIAIITGMNEAKLIEFQNNILTPEVADQCIIEYYTKWENKGIPENIIFSDFNDDKKEQICVGGIYLDVHDECNVTDSPKLVEVASTKTNLRKIALGIASKKAICLQGPVGSGKTSFVHYLAAKTGRTLGDSFIKIQLGDQTDSKMLLGTYRCTDIPGEFIWQPGVLTQAVVQGSWLLLEDIDSASVDIASVLSSLLENGYLTVPGYRDMLAITPGFQLFLTQRLITTSTGHHRKQTNASAILEKNVLQVHIEPLSNKELVEIIETSYPALKTISNRIVNVFSIFSASKSNQTFSHQSRARLTSTRDLFKWCSRAVIDFDVSSQNSALKVLQDAIDLFCCSYSNLEERVKLAVEISSHLGIINEKAEYFCTRYKPTLSLTVDHLKAGRAAIGRDQSIYLKQVNFCFTRPAACLLERIMCCVMLKEPVLLVGETGTGKTSAIQYLAHTIGQKIVVINMNQQSDSADLLGGFKPVDMKYIVAPIKAEFEDVFCSYFNVEQNRKYLKNLMTCFNQQKWNFLLKLMQKSYEAAMNRLQSSESMKKPDKREKYLKLWSDVGVKLQKLELQLKHKNSLAFSFIEGSLVKAIENGYWVLLDEINLASAETLECLSGLLEGSEGSLSLLERGDKKPVQRHPKFTLFACMNPSTDVGKKDLQAGLRNRFTEFFVDELTERTDLTLLVNSYLVAMSLKEDKLENIVKFYLRVREKANTDLTDGLGQKPHFSLRSLCRALTIASKNPCGTFNRSLYEAFCLSFLTQLDTKSYKLVESMIARHMVGTEKELKAVLRQPIPEPKEGNQKFLQFEGYWIAIGNLEPFTPEEYILTASVRKNLKDLARIVSIGKLPVLLQGDTSVGKTSLITFLAKASGNKCVRINNHEHTDLQEYVGSYVADTNGKLVFREGLLVQAMRQGHWIILDELNLAPTDVLEALNRVLDDNRELYIPETQETIKADPNFMLFATQNPPGSYGGRKMLSRAFRNRFVELHFMEIPPEELEVILHQRCHMALSYARKMISVMKDLQMRRRGSAAFAGKYGFITLRDLFRWGERYRLAANHKKLYDWDQHIADEGYLVLAGRVRKTEEKEEIAQVIEKHIKRTVDPNNLFTLSEHTSTVTRHILEKIDLNKDRCKNIVWTYNMRQLAVLVSKALEFKEPVLLVGETGGGKTTVCKLIAENNGQNLVTVNCHMNTESSDFLGGLRPVRDHTGDDVNKLFEWVDGPLVSAMTKGDVFLADEISLADDSVLERLNSLLEPERTLLLAEKGADINSKDNSEIIIANPNFYFIGTMNPGGDFGKKELSPALRNRFTEIWCESCTRREDLIEIIEQNIDTNLKLEKGDGIGAKIMDFIEWLRTTEIGKRFTISIRDILTWVEFMNRVGQILGVPKAYLHGACLTFLDSLGSGVTSAENDDALNDFKTSCLNFFKKQFLLEKIDFPVFVSDLVTNQIDVEKTERYFGIKPFYLELSSDIEDCDFSFGTPTTTFNALRLLRGLQLNKAILLEGSPGVGKTSLVMALAKRTGNKLFRVNLSDQTDISDLFGADLPVEGGLAGQFAWRDGPLLQAMKKGQWILLDELNLASQSVLEGLNACLDHRGEIFIPELGKTFLVRPGTKFFGCQNPLKQGGSRRGLPQSFLNRFTQVYINAMKSADLKAILKKQFPCIPEDMLDKMVLFNDNVSKELDAHRFGNTGAPWECNLRDLTRWCEATIYQFETNEFENRRYKPENLVELIYSDRMRILHDRDIVEEIFEEVFGKEFEGKNVTAYVTENCAYFGDAILKRELKSCNYNMLKQDPACLLLRHQFGVLRSLIYCVNLNWMGILVGSSDSGKSTIVKVLASLAGKSLYTLPVTSAMDTTDILGGFEQIDFTRHLEEIFKQIEKIILTNIQNHISSLSTEKSMDLLNRWERCCEFVRQNDSTQTLQEEIKLFLGKLSALKEICSYSKKILTGNSTELTELVNKIDKIIESVETEGSLNAGGKFEWVDSVLVKCLKEGSWLLVDNVNLCSPAVLDRLNALLEPNGTLIIGERGVDKDGKMFEVKPHKDFRLFLAMDHKNGEISRAMRNRGIEIFVLSNEIHENTYDTEALIDLNGIHSNELIEKLITIVSNNDKLCGTLDDKLNDLLQCSFLIAEQLKRGIPVKNAFQNTLSDLYYKNKSNKTTTDSDLDKLKEEIDALFNNFESRLRIYSSDLTLSTKLLQTCSKIGRIRQNSAILRKFSSRDPSTIDFKQVAQFQLIHTITSTNFKSIGFARNIFKSQLQQDILKASTSLFDLVNKFFKVHKNLEENLPIEAAWLPDTPYKTDQNDLTNKLFLLMYFVSRKVIFEPIEDAQRKKDIKSLTMLQYATAIKNKEIESRTDDGILQNCLDLLNRYDEFIMQLLFDSKIKLNYEETTNIMSLMEWRFNFYNILKTSVVHLKSLRQEDLSGLIPHFKWLVKHSFQALSSSFQEINYEKLASIVNKISETIPHHFSPSYKIAKIIRKTASGPPPLINNVQLNYFPDLNQAITLYDVHRSRCELDKIVGLVSDHKLRSSLVNLKLQTDYEVCQVPEDFTETMKNFGEFKSNTSNIQFQDVKFLPLQDYITLLHIHSKGTSTKRLRTNFQTVPISLEGLTMRFDSKHDERLIPEINAEIFIYKINAPCLNAERFLKFGVEHEEDQLKYMLHNPILSYLTSNLLISDKNSKNFIATCQFGKYRQAQILHSRISSVLWKNLKQISWDCCDFMVNEHKFITSEINYYRKLLITSSNGDNGMELDFNESLKAKVKEIQQKYGRLKSTKSEDDYLIENIERCFQLKPIKFENKSFEELQNLNTIADQYVWLNFFKVHAFSMLSPIDPLAKVALKKKYCLEEEQNFGNLKWTFELQNEVLSKTCDSRNPLCDVIETKIQSLKEKQKNLGKYIAVRPENLKYNELFLLVKHGLNSVVSPNKIINLYKNEEEICQKLLDWLVCSKDDSNSVESINLEQARICLNLSKSSLISLKTYMESLEKYRVFYPDIVEPIYSSLAQLYFGLTLKENVLQKCIFAYETSSYKLDLTTTLCNLITFPNIDSNPESTIASYTSQNLSSFVEATLHSEENRNLGKIECLRMLKCGIREMYNLCMIEVKYADHLERTLFTQFNDLIRKFLVAWNKQEEELDAKKKEAESLYKTKTKCDNKTEEEEIEDEFKKLFPSHHDNDFADMQSNLLGDTPEAKSEDDDVNYSGVISYEDLKLVSELHSQFLRLFTKTEWLDPDRETIKIDYLQSLLQKYKLFSLLINKFGTVLSYKLDSTVLPSLNVIAAIAKEFGDAKNLEEQGSPSRNTRKKGFHFYRDSNVEEIKSSYHILEQLRLRIMELLNEWPNHPTLATIITIIERIYNFDILSPISRFLTGFEILLSKCHEWEQNAHGGVSLMEHNQNITAQIITWRKMELNMWKDSLDYTLEQANESIPKWWFYIYGVMDLFTKEDKITTEELVEHIEKFIVQSTLAEFENRLTLIYVFHCHAVHLEKTEKSKIFVNVLWNMYNYFKQFLPNVAAKIKDQRSPIEKKLKDYVKIVRWKDVSYWAIKETLVKTQKTLHKYMREFDAVIKQPVTSCLVNTTSNEKAVEHVGIWDRPQRNLPKTYHYVMDTSMYLTKKSSATQEVNYHGLLDESKAMLEKSQKLFAKSRTLSKDTIDSAQYPKLIKCLDGFITDVIENSNHLQNLEIDTTLPKSKQKSQAKSILQQKHRALSDLFTNLTKLGLSYRTGIVEAKLKNSTEEFLLKPLDLTASLRHLEHTKINEKILTIWEGCESYYTKSLMRLDVLQTALQNPAKDLGMQNVERCKGFALNIFNIAKEQKASITSSTRNFYHLRYYLKYFSDICESSQYFSRIGLVHLSKTLKNTIMAMQQYKIVLNSIPQEVNFEEDPLEVATLEFNKNNPNMTKYSPEWNESLGEITQIVAFADKMLSNIKKCKVTTPAFDHSLIKFSYVPLKDYLNIITDISEIENKLHSFSKKFQGTSLSKSVDWLLSEFHKAEELGSQKSNNKNINIPLATFGQKVVDLITKILLSIQTVYKKYQANKEKSKDAVEDEENEEKLQENHLKNLLVAELFDDVTKINMQDVLNSTCQVASLMENVNIDKLLKFKSSLSQVLPLLEQVILLHQYFVTQQVSAYRITCKMSSILTNIFIDLATKGFCIPPELSDDEDAGGQSNQQSGGMGLGDGEGEKDASDRIESEDQLEDAQPAGQEKKKDEDKDCKEDKGIEMSEDFDSKLQDVEKKEGEDDEDSNSDSDANEQMGETEEGADQLDQQIWGSDDEDVDEAEENGKEQKEEKGNKGEKDGEQQLGAKDGPTAQEDEEEGNEQSKDEKKEKKKDINEMDEPEFDDEQVDPYHGNQPELPEPEPMDLPDDLQLDEGQEKDEMNDEENPFDIDKMKDADSQDSKQEEEKKDENKEEPTEDANNSMDSSDDEGNPEESGDKMDTEQAEPEEDEEDKNKEGIKEDAEKDDPENKNELSGMDQTQSLETEAQAMDVEDVECADNVETNQAKDKKASQVNKEVSQEDNPDKEGVGQSQIEESKTGHKGKANAQQESNSKEDDEVKEDKKRKPGDTESERALGNVSEPVKKKLKTMNMQNDDAEEEDEEEDGAGNNDNAEMYKHIKEAKASDDQVLDTATSEQAEQQKDEISKLEEKDKEVSETVEDLPEDSEDEDVEMKDVKQQKAEKVEGEKKKKGDKGQHPDGEVEDIEEVEIDGETVQTMTVARGETTHHISLEATMIGSGNERMDLDMPSQAFEDSCVRIVPTVDEEKAWQKMMASTSSLAQNLAEQLRLVLEPTQASRLKGDFKTGRRINMRKVIPYIASQFRKDKIWLRRTKPAKREYQIVLAIDDSSSMADNHSKELAFESVALISKALSILESGQLAVLSFGEDTEVVHKLSDTFSERSGAKLMQKFQFTQKKTCVGKLVEFATNMLNSSYKHTNAVVSKLLIIVSDGRGIFSEGENLVRQAVRKAKFSNIFMVFVIVDNPENSSSILDIRMPVFEKGMLMGIKSYMDVFPFPFYIILRNLDTLPNVLSDALRQWFEIVSNTST